MNNNGRHQEEIQDQILPQVDKRPRWKRMHHTWWFWFFLVLMLIGILYYVMSVDFAFAPRMKPQ